MFFYGSVPKIKAFEKVIGLILEKPLAGLSGAIFT